MQKNVAGQKLIVYAFDSTTNAPKTGDAANITAYVSKDFGAVTVLGDTSATEMDATNAKGYYLFDLTQAETNGDALLFTAKSSSLNVVVLGTPDYVQTIPAAFALVGGAAGGVLIAGANVATSFVGTAASGATPAVAALTLTGGAASTTGGGVASSGLKVVGGAGAGSTNGAVSGATFTGGGTNTVTSTASGVVMTGTSDGHGLDCQSAASSNPNVAHGIQAVSNGSGQNSSGIAATGGTNTGSNGILAIGGGATYANSATLQGAGLNACGKPYGIGATGASAGGTGLYCTAASTGKGAQFIGAGASSAGINISGGSSGDGIKITTTSGHGMNVVAAGTAMDGIHTVGAAAATTNAGGHGINTIGGASTTSAGGTAGSGLVVLGGAGSASTNGAASGATITGGGTNTVASTADGLKLTGTSNGSGLDCILAGTGASITASTISGTLTTVTTATTATNLTNAPTNGDFTSTMKTSLNASTPASVQNISAQTGDSFARIGVAGAGLTNIDLPDQTMNITGNITGNLSGSVGSVTGLTASNLDVAVSTRLPSATNATSIATILASTNNLPSDPADESLIIAATDAIMSRIGAPVGASISADIAEIEAETDAIASLPTANANADALLDRAAGVETGMTLRQAMRLISSVLLGKVSGAATATNTFRDVNDSTDRVVSTVDADGNRSAVTLDPS